MDANPADDAPLAGTALHDAKRAMRAAVTAARDGLPPAMRAAAAAAITARIAQLPSFVAARCVLLTLPFRSEWGTHALFAAAQAAGKTVVLPRVNSESRMLDLHAVTDLARDTVSGYRGIAEPRPGLPQVATALVDWVLVPGVAYDAGGRRLGYGGGFYDRLLASMPPSVARVAGAFDVQIVAHVPAAPHDLFVDTIATETRTLTANGRP